MRHVTAIVLVIVAFPHGLNLALDVDRGGVNLFGLGDRGSSGLGLLAERVPRGLRRFKLDAEPVDLCAGLSEIPFKCLSLRVVDPCKLTTERGHDCAIHSVEVPFAQRAVEAAKEIALGHVPSTKVALWVERPATSGNPMDDQWRGCESGGESFTHSTSDLCHNRTCNNATASSGGGCEDCGSAHPVAVVVETTSR